MAPPVSGNNTDTDMRITNFCVIRRINDIREERQGGAQTGGRTVDRGDNRLFHFQHVDNDFTRFDEEVVQLRGRH